MNQLNSILVDGKVIKILDKEVFGDAFYLEHIYANEKHIFLVKPGKLKWMQDLKEGMDIRIVGIMKTDTTLGENDVFIEAFHIEIKYNGKSGVIKEKI